MIALGCGVVMALAGNALPLAGVVALIVGSVLVARPDLGSLAFLFVLWINAAGVAARFHGVPDPIATLVGLVLLVPVARHLLRREHLVVTPALFALLFFLAANFLSAAFSRSPDAAAARLVEFLTEGVILYVLISNAIRTPRMLRHATLMLVAASVLMAGLSIHQELNEAYRDPYLGFAQTTRLEDPVTQQPDPDSRPRLSGPIGEQNRYAQVLLVVIPLALFGTTRFADRRRWVRPLAIGAAFIILAGVLLTFSRGAAVALGVLALLLVAKRFVPLKYMAGMAGAALLTIVLVAPAFLERVDSIWTASTLVTGEGEDPDGAIVGRTTSNLAALLVFVDHPIVGVGPGTYADDYSRAYANRLGLRHFETSRRAHNMYLEWGAELGIVGLSAGMAILLFTLVQLGEHRRYWRTRRPDFANLAGAYWLAIAAYMASAAFLHLSYERYLLTLLALANAAIWILNRERRLLETPLASVQLDERQALAAERQL